MKIHKCRRMMLVVSVLGVVAIFTCVLYKKEAIKGFLHMTAPVLNDNEMEKNDIEKQSCILGDQGKEKQDITPRNMEEISLVEQISNPRLGMYPWSTPGLVEKPFCSYAQEERGNIEFKYIPQTNLKPKEAANWGGTIIFDLVLEPEHIDDYGAILTKSSVEAWRNFQWIYENPRDYYIDTWTDCMTGDANSEVKYYEFWTYVCIPTEYFQVSNLDLLYALDHTFTIGVDRELINFIHGEPHIPEDYVIDSKFIDIGVQFRWEYEVDTGLIQILKMEYKWL